MIEPDDRRHGRNAGYLAGCHDACCKAAHTAYRRALRKRQYAIGGGMYVPAIGTHRRIKALSVMGYPERDISKRLGHSPSWASQIMTKHTEVHRRTAREIAKLYDQLSMTFGPSQLGRKRAITRGWHGPLAWDDETIDDPNAEPYKAKRTKDEAVDEVVILRALNGQKVTATIPERFEIVRRWQRTGQTLRTLELTQGWPAWRYTEKRAA